MGDNQKTVHLIIERQDLPDSKPYTEEFLIPWHLGMNVVSALMDIQKNPVTKEGKVTKPVVWECNCLEEVCGACAMLINGVPRQACSSLVDSLTQPRRLAPLSKFPIVRDLMVDRQKMFDNLKKSRLGLRSIQRLIWGRDRGCHGHSRKKYIPCPAA